MTISTRGLYKQRAFGFPLLLASLAFSAVSGVADDLDGDHFNYRKSGNGYSKGYGAHAAGSPSRTLDILVNGDSVVALPKIAGDTPTPTEQAKIEDAAAQIASLASSNGRINGFGRLTVEPTIKDHQVVALRIAGLDRRQVGFVINGPVVTRKEVVEIRNIGKPNAKPVSETRQYFEAHFPGRK